MLSWGAAIDEPLSQSKVLFRLLGDVRRWTTQRRRCRRSASLNFFADVTLACTRGRCRQGNNTGVSAETATSLQDEKCHRAQKRGDSPKAALGWTVSRMFAFLPPGGQFRRTNNRAGPANAGSRPISPPSLASSPCDRSIPAEPKPRRLCPNGRVAQSFRHH